MNDPFASFSDAEITRAATFTAAIMQDLAHAGPIPCVVIVLAARALGLSAMLFSTALGASQATGLFEVRDGEGNKCLPNDKGSMLHLTEKGYTKVLLSQQAPQDPNSN